MVNIGRAAQVANLATGRALPLLLNPFWANLPPAVISLPKDFFMYGTDFVPLGASATVTNNIVIQADSAFLILDVVGVATDTANTAAVGPPVPQLVRVRDEGSGRDLMNHAVHFDNFFGTGQLPSYLPYPKILKPRTTLSVTLQNLEATARNVRIDFVGFKLFGGEGFSELLRNI